VLSSLFQNQNRMAADGFLTLDTLRYAAATGSSRVGADDNLFTRWALSRSYRPCAKRAELSSRWEVVC